MKCPKKRGCCIHYTAINGKCKQRVNVYMTFLKPIDKAFGLCYL